MKIIKGTQYLIHVIFKEGIKYCVPLIMLAGCASTDVVYKNYNTMVNLQDGVDIKEAKMIAQRMLINTEEKDLYRISFPDIKTGPMVSKYPDYWFVVFGHNFLEPFAKDALTQSYKEILETEFLVVINKKTGRMPFYGQWFPKRENDFDWVFDQRAYNRKDPLVLPPGRQSKPLF